MPRYINAENFLQAQIKRCNNYPPIIGTCSMDNVALESEIMSFPIANVVPVKHARWIDYPECGVTKCSICGWNVEEAWDSKYCPDCGAKMDGEDNNG